MTQQNERPEPEFIETIIYQLNQPQFMAALAAGIIIGGFVIFAYLQMQKSNTGVPQLPILHEIVPEPPEEAPVNRGPDPFGNYQDQ